jgi:hypothetical protein
MIVQPNSIWQFIGSGPGKGDLQRVIGSDHVEVVTISERPVCWAIDWSWLGPTKDFIKQFKFVRMENT